MVENYWQRPRRYSRRSIIRGAGLAAGAVSLAPLIAACASSTKNSSRGATATATLAATGAGATKVAAGTPAPVKGGTLTLSTPSDVSLFDYAYQHDFFSNFIIQQCVESLLTHDTQAHPTGLLATSWENPDSHTYIFHLRQGVKFQDGTDFNADAVEYSMNRIHSDKASFRYQDLVYLDTITKPDPNTVKITLTTPFAPFLESLTGPTGDVISPAIGEKYGKDKLAVDLSGQGTGPFKFVEWKTADHVTLARNENYWGKDAAGGVLPYLDKVIVRVIPDENSGLASLRSGEVDGFSPGNGPPPKDTASVKADPSLTYRN